MKQSKALVFALIGVSLSSLAPAQASSARVRLHVSDFYAHAPEEPTVTIRSEPEKSPNCYVSLSATEVSRGIRHWTNKC